MIIKNKIKFEDNEDTIYDYFVKDYSRDTVEAEFNNISTWLVPDNILQKMLHANCSRKKFIKILMGYLIPRNEAIRIANQYFNKNKYYNFVGANYIGIIRSERRN